VVSVPLHAAGVNTATTSLCGASGIVDARRSIVLVLYVFFFFKQKTAYEMNAYALSEGKRLFSAYNCSGCHANGGGGMGPALMDDEWAYGYEADQIYSSILQGRPNGMPSFRGKVPDQQIWELVAYVRSLSGLAPKDAAPGRGDHMNGKPPENATPRRTPKNSGLPPASVR